MTLLKYLFSLVAQEDSELMRIFFAWIQNSNLEEIRSVAPSSCDSLQQV